MITIMIMMIIRILIIISSLLLLLLIAAMIFMIIWARRYFKYDDDRSRQIHRVDGIIHRAKIVAQGVVDSRVNGAVEPSI